MTESGEARRRVPLAEITGWILALSCLVAIPCSESLTRVLDPESAAGLSLAAHPPPQPLWNYWPTQQVVIHDPEHPLVSKRWRRMTSEHELNLTSLSPRDPWGNHYFSFPSRMRNHYRVLYSAGPNGLVEEVDGIYFLGEEQTDDIHMNGALASTQYGRARLWTHARTTLLVLALLIAWSLRGPFARRPRSPQVRTEVLRAGVHAAPFVAAALAAVAVIFHQTPWIARDLDSPSLALPPWLALSGTLLVACALGALAWRLTRPLQSPSPEDLDT